MKVVNVQFLGDMISAALDGEPVFIIRAQDKSAIPAISYYAQTTKNAGGKNYYRVNKALAEFEKWQSANESKVRVAD
jgi:hypothetical protein